MHHPCLRWSMLPVGQPCLLVLRRELSDIHTWNELRSCMDVGAGLPEYQAQQVLMLTSVCMLTLLLYEVIAVCVGTAQPVWHHECPRAAAALV